MSELKQLIDEKRKEEIKRMFEEKQLADQRKLEDTIRRYKAKQFNDESLAFAERIYSKIFRLYSEGKLKYPDLFRQWLKFGFRHSKVQEDFFRAKGLAAKYNDMRIFDADTNEDVSETVITYVVQGIY